MEAQETESRMEAVSLTNEQKAKKEVQRAVVIERNNLILVALGLLASIYFNDRAITLSFLGGGLLTVLNFRLLRMVVQNLIKPGQVSKAKLTAQVVIKFVGGLGLLIAIMMIFKPHPIAFSLGLSTLFVAIFLEGIFGIFRSE